MAESDAYVDHPLLTPDFIERRLYQIQLAGTARNGHTLVCLPTGLGKTTVSLLVTAERLHEVGGKSLFLAPTKPLVEQQAEFYRDALTIPDDEIVVFTGEVRIVTVPMHSEDKIPTGTLHSIADQCGADDFHAWCEWIDENC